MNEIEALKEVFYSLLGVLKDMVDEIERTQPGSEAYRSAKAAYEKLLVDVKSAPAG